MSTHKEVIDIVFNSNIPNPFHTLENKVKELEKKIDKIHDALEHLTRVK